jgi:hypothetical protein
LKPLKLKPLKGAQHEHDPGEDDASDDDSGADRRRHFRPARGARPAGGAESYRKGLSIKFSRRMPEVCPRAIALAQSGRVKLSPLATHRFSLDEVPAAFEQQVARRDGIVKAIIYP